MASTYSPSLRLELMATGDQSGTWGDTTNTNLGTLLEQAITGVLSVAQGDATLTLTALDGATDQSRNAVINLTGAMTGAQNVVVPNANKLYLIKNSTSGGFDVTVKTAAGSGVAVAAGTSQWVYADGTNVVRGLIGNGVPDTNGNISANSFLAGYTTTATAAGTTTLTVASTQTQYFTGTSTQTVTLPVVSTLVRGQSFEIVNLSTGAVTVNSSGGNLVTTVRAGSSARIQTILVTGTTAASWNAVTVGREVLTANRTYYVRTDGNDSNNGLADTAGGAFLTIQKAIDICSNALDFGGYTVTVQVADGTYTGAVTMKAMVGMATASSFVIQGNTGTPSNVLIHTTSATAISADGAGISGTISSLKVQTTTAGLGVKALNRASIRVVSVDFGAVADFQYAATGGGALFITGNYTISGNATFHMYASTGSVIVAENAGTITLTGTPAFSTFLYAETSSAVRINGNTYSGSATGVRYSSNSNATIFTNGAGASYLPGDSSGSTATGGQYI